MAHPAPAPNQIGEGPANRIIIAQYLLILIYAGVRILQVYPGKIPLTGVVALHVLPPLMFAVVHGAVLYRLKGILIFVGLCIVVGSLFETMGVLTGFPYGRYYFTEVMGPKLGPVPILLSLAYVGTGYIAWVLARLILGNSSASLTGSRVLFVPLVASFIMVAWDLSQDPVWSTVLRAWVWVTGGGYFGVPLSNFFGWYATAFVFYQLFAVYLRGRALNASALNTAYWQAPVLFYVVSAAGNLLLLGARPEQTMVADPAGRLWNVNDITGAGAMVSIFVMGAFALIAWLRLADTPVS